MMVEEVRSPHKWTKPSPRNRGHQPVPRRAIVTEDEWLTCTDPKPMLAFLGREASARKLRLFACACCRDIWTLLRQEMTREAVALAEHHADDRAGRDELRKARSGVSRAYSAASRDL